MKHMVHNVMMNTLHDNNQSSFALHFIIINFWTFDQRADTYLLLKCFPSHTEQTFIWG